AEKAAAEKAAAEKAAAEKAAAAPPASPSASIEVLPDEPKSGLNAMKIGALAVAAIFLLLIVYSYANTGKYYISDSDGAIEIYRGIFAPMGTSRMATLTGVTVPEEAKTVYDWKDAYGLLYAYHTNQADALLEVPGVPDAAALKDHLELAVKYAPNRELMEAAKGRLLSLKLQVEIQKAAAAINRRTIDSVEKGIAILQRASGMGISEAEIALVENNVASAKALLETLKAEKVEVERIAAEQAAMEAEADTLKEAAETAAPPVAAADDH
ncbi:MAG: hypothetical protein PVH30_14420, partial [Desulfobacterales bacterium]